MAKAANRRKIIFEDWDKDCVVISVGKKVRTKRGLEFRWSHWTLNTVNPKFLVEVFQDDTDYVNGRSAGAICERRANCVGLVLVI